MGNDTRRYDVIAIVVLFLMAVFLEYKEAFSLVEDETLSYRQILRTHYGDPGHTSPGEDVMIIYTDEAFYAEYGVYPLRRVDLALIVERLAEMNASVIGVDILLDFNSAYDEDPALESALRQAGNVLLVSQAEIIDGEYRGINRAIPRFDEYADSGYSNISPNSAISESIVRLRVYPEVADAGEWPFAVQAVANHLGAAPRLDGRMLSIGEEVNILLDQFGDIYIDYPLLPLSAEGGTLQLHDVIGLSASDILLIEDEEELLELSYLLNDKIVLIGEVAEVAHDEFETPVGNVYGVEVIANTISTLLRGAPLKAASFATELFVAVLLFLALLVTRMIPSPLPRNLLSVGIVLVYVLTCSLLYITAGLVLSMSYLLIASILAITLINMRYYLSEMGQKAMIRDAFGQYLSPRVVSDLVKDPEKLALGGEEREMTAFFSDIAGFSTFSENMTPTELVQVLNEYLTEMCNIIVEAEGTIDKFEGDAIIAFWGAPAIQQDHAKRACLAAIDMQEALGTLRARLVTEGRPDIKVRMGINSGPMVVGNMGSAQRMDYTIMGDSVNLAARLEGANKAYGSKIMISGTTWQACQDVLDVRQLDTVRVVGKNEPVDIYEVLAHKGQTRGLAADLLAQFEKGRACYLARDFEGALAAFKLAVSIDPDDGPSRTYVERCKQYIDSPPKGRWDGVFNLDEKG